MGLSTSLIYCHLLLVKEELPLNSCSLSGVTGPVWPSEGLLAATPKLMKDTDETSAPDT